jgi:hypothetical protein
MFFLLPLIGAAVSVVAGACITHANGEKDRQSSKHHRRVANELRNKYSDSQARYNELNNDSQKRFNDINRKKALDETEKDLLRLTIRLQQSLYILMWDIDENPTKESLIGFEQAVIATNKVLCELKEEIIQVPAEYFYRNLERAVEIGARHPSVLINENIHPILQCRKYGKKNRIRPRSDNRSPIYGDCKCNLTKESTSSFPEETLEENNFIIRQCNKCGIKNRLHPRDANLNSICGNCKSRLTVIDTIFWSTSSAEQKDPVFSSYDAYLNWFQIYCPSLKPRSETNFYYSWRYSGTPARSTKKKKYRNNRRS